MNTVNNTTPIVPLYAGSASTVAKNTEATKLAEQKIAEKSAEKANEKEVAKEANTDKFVEKQKTYSPGYSKSESEKIKFQASSSVKAIKNEAMKDMVQQTLNKQASGDKSTAGILKSGYNPLKGSQAIWDALQKAEKTSEKYADEDFWGVEATAERIVSFAKALDGGTGKNFDVLKKAFLKGFDQALGAKKGKLPDISYQTKDKALQLFDDWEKEIAEKNGTNNAPTATANK